ncbi:MAG TPA: glycosyltransferase family 4 protein [Polyangiales bacterium]|nr:glycosyltransferase family 4 protein [Polyangiales bacterium]
MKSSKGQQSTRRQRFHIVLSRTFDLEAMEQGATADKNPRHAMRTLAKDLDATVYDPSLEKPTWLDRVLGKLVATPEHWAMARRVVKTLGDDDVVFALGAEGMSFPLVSMLRRERPAFGLSLMSPDNKRMRMLLRMPLVARCVDLVVVSNEHKRGLVRELTSVSGERVFVLPEQTDTRFFRPGATAQSRKRPLIFSPGLEQRDYRTLAEAVRGMDVDVLVCAMSPNAVQKSAAFPEELPPNMTVKPLPWREFRQAYRDADLVVVPLRENLYSAGSTVVMEAMACRKPVIITAIPGIAADFAARDLLLTAPAGDAEAMRGQIMRMIADPALRESYAQRGFDAVMREHTLEFVMLQLAKRLADLRTGAMTELLDNMLETLTLVPTDTGTVPVRKSSAA